MQPCVFPFHWNFTTYFGCPEDYEDTTKTWCSTKVDEKGNHIQNHGKYGFCSNQCPVHQETAATSCKCYIYSIFFLVLVLTNIYIKLDSYILLDGYLRQASEKPCKDKLETCRAQKINCSVEYNRAHCKNYPVTISCYRD